MRSFIFIGLFLGLASGAVLPPINQSSASASASAVVNGRTITDFDSSDETRSEIGASATANAYASASSSSGGSYSSKTIDDLTQIIPCLNIDDFNLKPPSLVPVDQSENEEETPEPEAPNPDPIVDTPRDSFLAENGEVITADDPRNNVLSCDEHPCNISLQQTNYKKSCGC